MPGTGKTDDNNGTNKATNNPLMQPPKSPALWPTRTSKTYTPVI